MKQVPYETLVKEFNECILGRNNEYWPKMALSFDHDGDPIFFLIHESPEGEAAERAYIYGIQSAVTHVNNMLGYLKYGVTKIGSSPIPVIMELNA